MLKRIREMKDQDGFTLIELMVVVLIIAILIAIAIPTFLGLRERAQNRSAQSDLRNAYTAAKAHFSDGDTYVGFDTAAAGLEPSLTFNTDAAASEGEVSIRNLSATTVVLATESASGDTFCMGESAVGTTVTGDDDAANAAACTGGF